MTLSIASRGPGDGVRVHLPRKRARLSIAKRRAGDPDARAPVDAALAAPHGACRGAAACGVSLGGACELSARAESWKVCVHDVCTSMWFHQGRSWCEGIMRLSCGGAGARQTERGGRAPGRSGVEVA